MASGEKGPEASAFREYSREIAGIRYEFGLAVVDELIGQRIEAALPQGNYQAELAGLALYGALEAQTNPDQETMYLAQGGTDWQHVQLLTPTKIAEFISGRFGDQYDPAAEVPTTDSLWFSAFTAQKDEVAAFQSREGHWSTSRQAYDFVEEARRQREIAGPPDDELS